MIKSITEALEQYGANLDYDDDAEKAKRAREALRYLRRHRGQAQAHVGTSISFEDITGEIEEINRLLAALESGRRRTSFTAARARWT